MRYATRDPTWMSPSAMRLAPTLATLAGASIPEVVAMNSLTLNLHLLMASFYRPTRERHVILIDLHRSPRAGTDR